MLVDQTEDILGKALKSIEKSLERLVKKKFKDDAEVCEKSCMAYAQYRVLPRTIWVPVPVGPGSQPLTTFRIFGLK